MWNKIQRIYIWDQKVRPKEIYEYDFTQSDAWWTKSTNTISRGSNWFYISWRDVDGYITPPNNIYTITPKKITILFNRWNSSWVPWTWIYTSSYNYYWYFLPRNSSNNKFDWNTNGTITSNSITLTSTSDITWELDIDNSTTNWDITHKITGNNNITDTNGTLKYLWEHNAFWIRTVYWNYWTWPYIKKVTIEY